MFLVEPSFSFSIHSSQVLPYPSHMIMSGQNNPFDHYYIILTGQNIPHLRIILPLTSTLVRSKCLHFMRMGSLLSEMSSVVIWSRFSIRHQKMSGQTGPSIVKWLTIMDLLYFTRSIDSSLKMCNFLSSHSVSSLLHVA